MKSAEGYATQREKRHDARKTNGCFRALKKAILSAALNNFSQPGFSRHAGRDICCITPRGATAALRQILDILLAQKVKISPRWRRSEYIRLKLEISRDAGFAPVLYMMLAGAATG